MIGKVRDQLLPDAHRLRFVWRMIFMTIVCGAMLSLTGNAVFSQVDSPFAMDEDSTRTRTLDDLCGPVAKTVVQLKNADRLCCLGVIVDDGLVVTKLSELSGSLVCVAADGTEADAFIVASHFSDDLALLQLSLSSGNAPSFETAIRFRRAASIDPGDLLFSIGNAIKPIGVGIATVQPQVIPIKQPRCRDCIDLGVTVSPKPGRIEIEQANLDAPFGARQIFFGAIVDRVYPRTVGERVGLLEGDLLFSVNQQSVTDAMSLRFVGSQLRIGQTLDVLIVRHGSIKKLSMKIAKFSRRVYHDRWGGGPFSDRRFGFGEVIVHDGLLRPDQCGGPVVDLKGDVIGINIARSLRVATFAIPADRVLAFVNRGKPVTIPLE